MWRAFCRVSGAISIGILLVLGLVAGASAQSVKDFDEIQASPVVIRPDPGGRSAILEVETSIDVACSVVYGTDESFGLIAVDSDMDGGAHADHHPVMGGLEPDTTYVYRLQGTAPDGTIYVSEVMSFQTPPEPVGGPVNLALGATVTDVSSEWSDAFGAENAFDGDPTTEWSSRGDGNDAWVEIDLGAPQAIGDVIFRTRSMSDGSATTASFRVTADGVGYGPFPADEPFGGLSDLGVVAQVLRFDVETSTGGNTGAVEIVVLEPGTGAS
jgi:hypothetical protein